MINKLINELSANNRFSYYSSFFRVFICFFLLKEVITHWNFYELFLSSSFFSPPNITLLNLIGIETSFFINSFPIFKFIHIAVIILFMFGIGKRWTAIVLYFTTEIMTSLTYITLDGGDNLMKFALLYFIFIDSYERYSFKPLRYKSDFLQKNSNFISNLAGYSLLFHFCVVYFVSSIHKIHADVWFNGVATYYIFSIDTYRGTQWNLDLVKNGYFVTITTYGTLFIELFFPFLVWDKRFKFFFLVLAAMLHAGIAVFMMLYDFQIFFILYLGFFITNDEWGIIMNKVNSFTDKIKLSPKKISKTNLNT